MENDKIQAILARMKEEIIEYQTLRDQLVNKEPKKRLYLSGQDYQHNMAILVDALVEELID